MANERGKSIDNTHLSIDNAEERRMIHRDYIAHVFRWTHVAKKIGTSLLYKTARVLDVGCGVDVPLGRMLYSNKFITNDYVGLDYNKSHKFKVDMFAAGKFPMSAYGSVDFASKQVSIRSPEFGTITQDKCLYVDGDVEEGEHELPTFITCFEVLEHVEPGHARAMLKKMGFIAKTSELIYGEPVQIYISTPCYDSTVGAAANHVNEMTRNALGALIEDLGFEIVENFGTFASMRDYKDELEKLYPGASNIFDNLRKYYDSNVLANIFAPLVPQHSRNNIWGLRMGKEVGYTTRYVRKFPHLPAIHGRWTSSERWQELNDDNAYELHY